MTLLTPYSIDGAMHPGALFRRQLQYALGDGSGIARPADFRVRPLNQPGRGVRIAEGGVIIQSRDSESASRGSYGVENIGEIEFFGGEGAEGIPGTGSGETRRDMIVVEIRDPEMAGVPEPSDWDTAEFARIRVLPGVGATATKVEQLTNPDYANLTAYCIAVINWPASTTTISAGMIQDVREVQSPRRHEAVFARPRVTADDSARQNLLGDRTSDGGEYFPGGAGFSNTFSTTIPVWANRLIIDANWMSVRYLANRNVWGRYWVEFGDEYRPKTWPGKQQWEFATQHFQFDSAESGGTYRTDWRLMDNRLIPAKLRGKEVTFAFKGGLGGPAATPAIPRDGVSMDQLSGLGMRLTFVETALGCTVDSAHSNHPL